MDKGIYTDVIVTVMQAEGMMQAIAVLPENGRYRCRMLRKIWWWAKDFAVVSRIN